MSERKSQFDQLIGRAVPDWVECQSPRREVIAGRYCRLEPVEVGRHTRDLFDAYMEAPDARDWAYLPAERPETAERFQSYLTELAKSDDPLYFAILDGATGKPLGTAALMGIDTTHGVIEIGEVAYSSRLRRMNIGTESLYLLRCQVLDELGYRRCAWRCDSLDVAARAAADRIGFVAEGICRDAAVHKGGRRDTVRFSILAEECPVRRTALEIWLNPRNFDKCGRQKECLWEICEGLKRSVHAVELLERRPSGVTPSVDLAGQSEACGFSLPRPAEATIDAHNHAPVSGV